jgi:large subunit ribosomal protein L19
VNLIQQIEAEEIAKSGKDIPEFRAGDTVRVGVKVKEGNRERVQNYEGVVIARSNRGMGSNFTVRKMSFGEGVERVFPLYSPIVESITVVRRGVVRQALLPARPHRQERTYRRAPRQHAQGVRLSSQRISKGGLARGRPFALGTTSNSSLRAPAKQSKVRPWIAAQPVGCSQ